MRIFIFLSFILLTTTTIAQKTTQKIDKKLLLGLWVSDADNKYKISVTDSTFLEFYDKEPPDTFRYKIKKARLIKTDASGDAYEYDILTLTSTYFSIMYMPRGNVLTFSKRK